MKKMSFSLVLLTTMLGAAFGGTATWSSGDNVNVYGRPLAECSLPGMAVTGYTRTGYCNLHQGDSGSHNVCVDISNVANGQNFCEITGQSDWCSENDRCDSQAGYDCPRQNWCICEWAFASLINAKGCGAVSTEAIQCEAVSGKTIVAYREAMSLSSQYGGRISSNNAATALQCLQSLCELSDEYVASIDYTGQNILPQGLQRMKSDSFSLQAFSRCAENIQSKEECIEAAQDLGLGEYSAEDCGCQGTSKPAKCYWANNKLWYNPRTTGSCGSDYVCVCRGATLEVGDGSPSAMPIPALALAALPLVMVL